MRTRSTFLVGLVVLAVGARSLTAQTAVEPPRRWWVPEPALALLVSSFATDARSDAFGVIFSELTITQRQLRPQLSGAEAQLLFFNRLALVAGVDVGSRTVASTSRARPLDGAAPSAQWTELSLRPMRSIGVRWLQPIGNEGLRLSVGGGTGRLEYSLRQYGEFYDVAQDIRFDAEFQSGGTTPFSYLGVGGLASFTRFVDLSLDLRRQWGKAPMSSGFGDFAPLNLGGLRVAFGAVVHADVWR